MKKKPSNLKKFLVGAGISIIVIPALTLSWKNIQSIWAAPEAITDIKGKVDKHSVTEEQLSKLIIEQEGRLDTQEQVSKAQIEALNKQLELLAQLKSRR